MDTLFELISQYQKICVYRHINPDFDAFGSQYGIATVIKDLYPDKQVMIQGDKKSDLLETMGVDAFDHFEDYHDALAIVVDTANFERIDGDHVNDCAYCIKIDHHPVVDSYGQMNIEDPLASSASQIVAALCMEELGKSISSKAARYLYFGIVGDSNRFMYRNTSQKTFKAAAYLVECGIDIEEIYQSMYMQSKKDLEIQSYILNHYHVYGKAAYYVLKKEDLDYLGINRSRGSDYVNLLANIKEFEVWLAITENEEQHNFRVSLRSRNVPINDVAASFHGGGHELASGATLDSLDELDSLLEMIQDKIKKA